MRSLSRIVQVFLREKGTKLETRRGQRLHPASLSIDNANHMINNSAGPPKFFA
jgi:hypothetical protein